MAEERPTGLIADLVARADSGDRVAKDALFTALYGELHRLAHSHIQRSAGNLTLSTTTLLHEAYLDISNRDAVAFGNRGRFLAYASRAMRGLIIGSVRDRKALKRGGELSFSPLLDSDVARTDTGVDLERLDEALDELAAVDPDLAELVDLKFFCGFSFVEIAALRGVSERTVQRDWAKARMMQVLVVFRRVHGPEHYDIAVAVNNLGALYQVRGEHARALAHYRRALAMKTRLLGPNHVDIGITLNNLATLQTRRGQTKAAKASYERALEIFTRSLPPQHPTRVRCRANYERLAARGREQGSALRLEQGAHKGRRGAAVRPRFSVTRRAERRAHCRALRARTCA